jgi:hypothetical protein
MGVAVPKYFWIILMKIIDKEDNGFLYQLLQEKVFIHSGSGGGLESNISLHSSSVNLFSIGCLNS